MSIEKMCLNEVSFVKAVSKRSVEDRHEISTKLDRPIRTSTKAAYRRMNAAVANQNNISNLRDRAQLPNNVILVAQNFGFRNEEKRLRDDCALIGAQIRQEFIYMGVRNSSAYKEAIERHITEYLERIGTPTAERILIEYQKGNFANV